MRVIQEAVARSEARQKHLWLLPSVPLERMRRYGCVTLYDLRGTFGKKRVNIIPLPVEPAARVLEAVANHSYSSRRAVKGDIS